MNFPSLTFLILIRFSQGSDFRQNSTLVTLIEEDMLDKSSREGKTII